MAHHHPPMDLLIEYAAGALPVAQSACVAAHLSYCQHCRQLVERLEDVGGAHLERLDPQPVGESVLESVMARLDDPEPLRYAPSEASETQLPGLLDRLINGDYADLVWKRVTQSLSISYLKTGDPNHEFALYRIAEGGRIPEHTHGGSEMTLVLRGGLPMRAVSTTRVISSFGRGGTSTPRSHWKVRSVSVWRCWMRPCDSLGCDTAGSTRF